MFGIGPRAREAHALSGIISAHRFTRPDAHHGMLGCEYRSRKCERMRGATQSAGRRRIKIRQGCSGHFHSLVFKTRRGGLISIPSAIGKSLPYGKDMAGFHHPP
jgi:hypothetical protein